MYVFNYKEEGLLGSGFPEVQQAVQSSSFRPATIPLSASTVYADLRWWRGLANIIRLRHLVREEHDFCGDPFPHRSDSKVTLGTQPQRAAGAPPPVPLAGGQRDSACRVLLCLSGSCGSWPPSSFPFSGRETAVQSTW